MIFKRIMSLILTAAMLFSFPVFADEAPAVTDAAPLTQEQINKEATGFVDISADAPYAAAVKKLVDFGIIAGYPDGTFKPFGEVTRAEMCKMINLTLGYTDVEGAAGFPDVTSENWFYQFALAAQKQGYVKGYEDNTFRGGNNITRQEVCAILDRLLKPMNLGIPVVINDEVSSWARPHVELIVQNFIMPLEAGNTFRATENLKRHELATVLSNMAIGPVNQIEAKVRFFVNGEQYGETQNVKVGNIAVVPAAPAAPNVQYEFDGWRQIGTEDVVDVASIVVTADVDYEAVFVKKHHEVNFFSNGKIVDRQSVEHGKRVSAPENPTLKGYNFLGWALEENGNVVRILSVRINEPKNFYAVFEKADDNEFYVNFFVEGDLYDSQKVKKNDSPVSPRDPEVENKTFIGWSLRKNGEIVSPESLRITRTVTLYAVFEDEEKEEEFTVTFFVDGNVRETQTVKEGDSPITPVSPSKDGYTFLGWSRSAEGNIVNLDYYKVTADVVFHAVFEKKEEEKKYFNVYFHVDGTVTDFQEVAEGEFAKVPVSPSKNGYTFLGWSKTEGGKVISVSSVEITEDTDFYAVFEEKEPEKYTVTFFVDGKKYDEQTVVEKNAPESPENPSKDGYTFKGWAKSEDGAVVSLGSERITYNTSYYAIFEKKEEKKYFTVTFYVDSSVYQSREIAEGDVLTIPAKPSKDGYVFKGWSDKQGGSVISLPSVVKADADYYAVFEEIKKYKVKFVVDSNVYYELSDVAENSAVRAPVNNPSKEDCIFLGWSLEKDGTVVSVPNVKINEDTTFYAVFEKIVKFKVSFVVDGSVYRELKVLENERATAPSQNPAKEGFVFLGWSTSQNGETVNVSSVKIEEDTVFYAVFEKIVKYKITFVVDGTTYSEITILENESVSAPSQNPAKDGHTFKGWSKTPGGDVVSVGSQTITADTTFYAIFEKKEEKKYFTVTFMVDSSVYESKEYAENDAISVPANPAKKDHVFEGWSKSEGGSVTSVASVAKENVTYYAVFREIKKYTIRFIVDGRVYEEEILLQDEFVTVPDDPSKSGFTFLGWSKSEGGSVTQVVTTAKADATYYAVFREIPKYVVSFIVDGSTHSTKTVTENETVSAPSSPKKNGYEFLGWSLSKTGNVVEVSDIEITANTTFYAIFEKIPVYYSVTFMVDGKKYDEQEILEGEYPDAPDEPEKDGFIFLGWSTSENGNTLYPEKSPVRSNVTYYAVFEEEEEEEEEVKEYNVFFWVDGEFYEKFLVKEGDVVDEPAEPRLEQGATFHGWATYEKADKDDVEDLSSYEITRHTDFHAVITKNYNSPELMEKLQTAYKCLGNIRASGLTKSAINIIRDCIGDVIDDANDGARINSTYVQSEYSDRISEVKDIYNNQMNSSQQKSFVTMLTSERNIPKDVQDFLAEYFNINF